MKARVKATGEIVEVEDCGSVFRHGALFHGYKDANGIKYLPNEIELQMDFDYWEACQDETPDSPDYWTRLEHQVAIAAMGGICGNSSYNESSWESMAEDAILAAHFFIQKLKEKEERK